MNVIAKAAIMAFILLHPDAESALMEWWRLAKRFNWDNPNHLRETFASASFVGPYTVFNIGGNKYRLIVTIHYNRRRIFIREILTHAEYDKVTWRGA